MDKIRIGIDIGAKGAIAVFKNDILVESMRFPKKADETDLNYLSKMFLRLGTIRTHVVIEDLHAVFNSSAKSNFTFGVNNGLIIGMLQVMQIPFTKVAPKTWQKEIWQGIREVKTLVKGKKMKDGSPKYKVNTKATSLLAANRLFPNETFLASERCRVPDDNIVDAVLLGEYCRRKF